MQGGPPYEKAEYVCLDAPDGAYGPDVIEAFYSGIPGMAAKPFPIDAENSMIPVNLL